MKKSLILLTLTCFLIVFALTGCSSGSAPAAPATPATPAAPADKPAESTETYTIKLGHTGVVDHYYQEGSEEFARLINEKTNGRVTVEVYPSDQLGNQRSSVEGCQIGTQDMVLTSSMILANFDESIGVFDLPFLFPDRKAAYAAMDGEVAKDIEKKFEDKGLIILGWWENGFRHITTADTVVNTPEDLKGLKIRTPESAVYIDTFTALGAAPTPMAFGELFSALQLKTVDGQENPAGHVITQRFYEVQNNISLTGHFYTPEPLVMSKIVYDKMPADIQQALREAGKEAGEFERQRSEALEQEYLAQIKETGMVITNPDIPAFQEAVKPVLEKYKDVYGDSLAKILGQ